MVSRKPPRSRPARRRSVRHDDAGDAACDRILTAARELFPTRGYHGTGIRDITRAARVNLGSVTYHFGSKAALYHALLNDVTAPLRAGFVAIHDGPGTPLEKIEAIVRHFFSHVQRHPEMIPLMVREMAGAGDLAPPIRDLLQTVGPIITGIIAAGQQRGEVRAGDPLLLTLSTMAQPVYLNLSRKGVRTGAGRDPMDQANAQATIEHALTMVREMLRKP